MNQIYKPKKDHLKVSFILKDPIKERSITSGRSTEARRRCLCIAYHKYFSKILLDHEKNYNSSEILLSLLRKASPYLNSFLMHYLITLLKKQNSRKPYDPETESNAHKKGSLGIYSFSLISIVDTLSNTPARNINNRNLPMMLSHYFIHNLMSVMWSFKKQNQYQTSLVSLRSTSCDLFYDICFKESDAQWAELCKMVWKFEVFRLGVIMSQ